MLVYSRWLWNIHSLVFLELTCVHPHVLIRWECVWVYIFFLMLNCVYLCKSKICVGMCVKALVWERKKKECVCEREKKQKIVPTHAYACLFLETWNGNSFSGLVCHKVTAMITVTAKETCACWFIAPALGTQSTASHSLHFFLFLPHPPLPSISPTPVVLSSPMRWVF